MDAPITEVVSPGLHQVLVKAADRACGGPSGWARCGAGMVSGLSSVPCRRLVRLRHGGPRSGNVRGSRCALSTGGRRPRAERQRASVRSRKSTALRDGACAGLDTRRVPSTMETRLRRPKSWRSWAAGQCPNGRNGWPCAASSSSGQTARQARCRVSVGRPGRRGHRNISCRRSALIWLPLPSGAPDPCLRRHEVRARRSADPAHQADSR